MTAASTGDAAWGWVEVPPGADPPAGGVVEFVVGDLELVVWRGHDGRPCAMDARCPHQWSHLAAEGTVDGTELLCTAHFWRFDRDGRGSKVNVNGRRDTKADIDVFECREIDGHLAVRLPI